MQTQFAIKIRRVVLRLGVESRSRPRCSLRLVHESRTLNATGLLIVVGLLALLSGRSHASDDQQGIEFFEKQVRPLLVQHCYECHAGDEQEGGLLLDSRPGWQAGGDSGPAIAPRDLDASLLIEAVRYRNLDLQMPPQNPLDESQVKVLERWIELGAPDPRTELPNRSDPRETHAAGMSIEDGRRFWALLPIQRDGVPAVTQTDWVVNSIDAFILAQLEAKGLRPGPMADRETLIRRVTLDLTGVPPTPDEIDRFLADDSPNAWARLVDRLLASPMHGERWGRHWLDVARYADSNGLDENLAFGHAWRYRDYVIDAINEDKSYDRFLIEQLAGDLLPDANVTTKTATGFLVLGAKVLAEPDSEKLFVDTIDEQIDTTGKAFLGLTLGCARCHDHKFDPIQQTDYYGLAAIFKSTRTFADTKTGVIKHWYEHSFASDEELERIEQVEAEIKSRNLVASQFKSKAVAELRQQAAAKAMTYLIAATEVDPGMSLNDVQQVAIRHDLHPRVLHHCRLHLEYHRDDPFFTPWFGYVASGDVDGIASHYGRLFKAARNEVKPTDEQSTEAEERVNKEETTVSDRRSGENISTDGDSSTDGDTAADTDSSVDGGKVFSDAEVAAAKAALNDSSGFLAVPAQPQFAFAPETLEQYYELLDIARKFESQAGDAAAAMGVEDGDVIESIPLHIRGSHTNLGDPVPRGIPDVFSSGDAVSFSDSQSGRLELAQWMSDERHPLTARVHANRVWRWHFGRGLVGTTENFGALGDRPSHPELLDWLARELVENEWSTKHLHRLILLSNTYRLSSVPDAIGGEETSTANRVDPENRSLARFPLERMSAEQIRDSILHVAGCLDTTIGGKTVPLRNRQFVFNHTSQDHTKYDSRRRAVYLPIIRNNLDPFLAQFDYPDPTMPTGDRNTTVVAPQTLILMNSEFVMEAADEMARQLLLLPDRRQRVVAAYRRAYGRLPTDREAERTIQFVQGIASELQAESPDSKSLSTQTAESLSQSTRTANDGEASSLDGQHVEQQAWSLFCQSLFASNEFIFVR